MQTNGYLIRNYRKCAQGNGFYTKIFYEKADEEQSPPDSIMLTVTGLGKRKHCRMSDFPKT